MATKRDGSKSKAIRELLNANPNIATDAVMAALKKQGMSCSKQTVYAIKSEHKKKTLATVPQIKTRRKKAKSRKQFHHAPISDPGVEIEILKRDLRKFKDIMMRLLLD